ncbi:hypothetical protein ACWDE9_21835 [Streptomyces olivaceoviridis]
MDPRTWNSQDGTSVCRPPTECAASPNTAFSTVTVSSAAFGAPVDAPHGCSSRSFSGSGLAHPPIPIRWPSPAAPFSSSSVFAAPTTGYVSPFTGIASSPCPPTSSPFRSTVRPVVQPYVGSPPTTGSASTTRRAPMTRLASVLAPPSPAALSTGAAALSASAALTGSPAGAPGSCAQTVTFRQLSVPGAYRSKLQPPGASRFTVSLGPEPSCPPTRQIRPSATGAPSTPSAFASRTTRSRPTSAPGSYTGAEPGPSGSSPRATYRAPYGSGSPGAIPPVPECAQPSRVSGGGVPWAPPGAAGPPVRPSVPLPAAR